MCARRHRVSAEAARTYLGHGRPDCRDNNDVVRRVDKQPRAAERGEGRGDVLEGGSHVGSVCTWLTWDASRMFKSAVDDEYG